MILKLNVDFILKFSVLLKITSLYYLIPLKVSFLFVLIEMNSNSGFHVSRMKRNDQKFPCSPSWHGVQVVWRRPCRCGRGRRRRRRRAPRRIRRPAAPTCASSGGWRRRRSPSWAPPAPRRRGCRRCRVATPTGRLCAASVTTRASVCFGDLQFSFYCNARRIGFPRQIVSIFQYIDVHSFRGWKWSTGEPKPLYIIINKGLLGVNLEFFSSSLDIFGWPFFRKESPTP